MFSGPPRLPPQQQSPSGLPFDDLPRARGGRRALRGRRSPAALRRQLDAGKNPMFKSCVIQQLTCSKLRHSTTTCVLLCRAKSVKSTPCQSHRWGSTTATPITFSPTTSTTWPRTAQVRRAVKRLRLVGIIRGEQRPKIRCFFDNYFSFPALFNWTVNPIV